MLALRVFIYIYIYSGTLLKNKLQRKHVTLTCFFSLEMKTTKRSDPSPASIPLVHNFLQRWYTFSSLQDKNKLEMTKDP